jgi:molybdopterin-guanine dinucleotide biosynthesis protein A
MNLIVLAGGKSSRVGFDKAKVKIGGLSLIQLVVSRISALFDRIIIITGDRQEEYCFPDYEQVRDHYKGAGPLAGIHAGLNASDSEYNFFIACDMPQIPIPLITHMMTFKGYDAVVPRKGIFVEPLCAIYNKSILPMVEECIREKKLKIQDMFPKLHVKYIEEDEVNTYDPGGQAFFNINTQDDFRRFFFDMDVYHKASKRSEDF